MGKVVWGEVSCVLYVCVTWCLFDILSGQVRSMALSALRSAFVSCAHLWPVAGLLLQSGVQLHFHVHDILLLMFSSRQFVHS